MDDDNESIVNLHVYGYADEGEIPNGMGLVMKQLEKVSVCMVYVCTHGVYSRIKHCTLVYHQTYIRSCCRIICVEALLVNFIYLSI